MKIVVYRVILFLLVIIVISCKNDVFHKKSKEGMEESLSNTVEQTSVNKKSNVAYYVIAPSGLSVRKAPDLTSEKIGLLAYGSEVSILEQTNIILTIKERESEIKGKWTLIQFQGTIKLEGYVFGGFLSKDNPRADLRLTNADLTLEKDDLSRYGSLELISEKDFFKNMNKQNITVFNDTEEVRKVEGKMSLPTDIGIVIVSDKITNDLDETTYRFLGTLENLNVFVVFGGEIGEVQYTLVDKETGEKQVLSGVPITSPDNSKCIVLSSDSFEVAPMTIQLFDINQNLYEQFFKMYVDAMHHSLSLEDVFWVNNKEVYMKVVAMKLINEFGPNLDAHYYQYILLKLEN